MVRVVFTPHLERHVQIASREVAGATVKEVLEAAFTANNKARPYILDDQGAVRKHIAIFVNGTLLNDRTHLSDPVPPGGEVYVMQALSGG